jgi:hypothetical protein
LLALDAAADSDETATIFSFSVSSSVDWCWKKKGSRPQESAAPVKLNVAKIEMLQNRAWVMRELDWSGGCNLDRAARLRQTRFSAG